MKIVILGLLCSCLVAADTLPFSGGVGGLRWGASLDDVRKAHPSPTALMRVTDRCLIYCPNLNCALVITDKQLSGAIFGGWLDYTIYEAVDGLKRSAEPTVLGDGLSLRMSYDDVATRIGQGDWSKPTYSQNLNAGGLNYSFKFSSSSSNGVRTYFLHKLIITSTTVGGEIGLDPAQVDELLDF